MFWRFCEKQFGYKDANPTIQKFLVTMLVTYMDAQMNGNEPEPWKIFVSRKKNDAVVFIKNLMSNSVSKDFYSTNGSRYYQNVWRRAKLRAWRFFASGDGDTGFKGSYF